MNVRSSPLLLLGVVGCQHAAPSLSTVPTVLVPPAQQDARDADSQSACATLPKNLAHFRVTESPETLSEDEDANLMLVRLDPEKPVQTFASSVATVLAKEVVTSDGLVGYVLRFGEISGDRIAYDCGSLATCVHGYYVACEPNALVEVIPADYRYILELAADWSRHGDQSWRDVLETDRRGSGMAEEAEFIKNGEPLVTVRRWKRGENGYQAGEWSE